MTTLLLALLVIQAACLFWASVRLSNIFLLQDKAASLAWFVATFALPVAIAWWARALDPRRFLCGWGDCIALAVSVAFVRYWAVSREAERHAEERQLAVLAAAQAAENARKALVEQRVRTAAAALEARKAREPRPARKEPSKPTPPAAKPARRPAGGPKLPRFPDRPAQ